MSKQWQCHTCLINVLNVLNVDSSHHLLNFESYSKPSSFPIFLKECIMNCFTYYLQIHQCICFKIRKHHKWYYYSSKICLFLKLKFWIKKLIDIFIVITYSSVGFGRPSGGNTLTTNRVCMGMTIGKLEIKRGSNDSILNSSRPGKNGESCMLKVFN